MHAKATSTFKLIKPLPRDAMMSVLHVCLSVTSRYSITAIARLTIQSALDGSLRTRDKNLGENACGHWSPTHNLARNAPISVLWVPPVHISNGMTIGSAIFAGLALHSCYGCLLYNGLAARRGPSICPTETQTTEHRRQ